MMSEEKQKPFVPPSVLNPESLAYINATIKATVTELFFKHGSRFAEPRFNARKDGGIIATPEFAITRSGSGEETGNSRAQIVCRRRSRSKGQRSAQPSKLCTSLSDWSQLVRSNQKLPRSPASGNMQLLPSTIFPREWRIGAPDENNPRGRAFIADADPQYDTIVRELLAVKG